MIHIKWEVIYLPFHENQYKQDNLTHIPTQLEHRHETSYQYDERSYSGFD